MHLMVIESTVVVFKRSRVTIVITLSGQHLKKKKHSCQGDVFVDKSIGGQRIQVLVVSIDQGVTSSKPEVSES